MMDRRGRLLVLVIAFLLTGLAHPAIAQHRKGSQPPKAAAASLSAPICDGPGGACQLPGGPSTAAPPANRRGQENTEVVPLEFALPDAYGREIHASDYRGLPLLIVIGACWCGGCQQDAEVLRDVEQKYRSRGLQTIRCTAWDNELPTWEFQKHYRLSGVPLLDSVREFERRYNRSGWTFVMLADAEGQVIYRANCPIDWPTVEARIGELLPPRPPTLLDRDGIAYLPVVLRRSSEPFRALQRDSFPSVACALDGRVYVAFTSNRNGTQDIFLRVFDGQEWSPDRPVAATEADEFDGGVLVDRKGVPWVSWTSNANGPRYDVYAAPVPGASSPIRSVQLTHSADDAMHARMALDSRGRLWVTHYKWQKLGSRSRDKEVYVQRLEGGRWSGEMRISPSDVPSYEDHTEPAIVAHGDSVIIAWSWDFHHPAGYSRVPSLPTIFLREIGPEYQLGRIRAISGPHSDTRPALGVASDGRLWCAWESADSRSRGKTISTSLEDLTGDEQPGPGADVSGAKHNVCTPCLAVSPRGEASLVWAEAERPGLWMLKQATWDAESHAWGSPKTLVSEGNPRFPSAAYASDGTLWVAYAVEREDRREIAVLPIRSRHGDKR